MAFRELNACHNKTNRVSKRIARVRADVDLASVARAPSLAKSDINQTCEVRKLALKRVMVGQTPPCIYLRPVDHRAYHLTGRYLMDPKVLFLLVGTVVSTKHDAKVTPASPIYE